MQNATNFSENVRQRQNCNLLYHIHTSTPPAGCTVQGVATVAILFIYLAVDLDVIADIVQYIPVQYILVCFAALVTINEY